jgi:cytochrome bd-type quinol oxidase subunit 1
VLVVRPFKLKYMMCLVKLKATLALAEAKANKAVYHTLAPFGFIAILAGWTVAEVGRQPWLATGILRTADAASPVPAAAVAATLVLFLIVYGIVFAAGILYMNRLIDRGPAGEGLPVDGVPSRPISAAGAAGKQLFGEEGEGNA